MSNETEVLDSDEQAAAEAQAEEARRLARAIEIDDVKWLMSDKRGRRFMWRLLAGTGLYRSSFVTNAMQVSFNEGQRQVGLGWLGEVMENTPENFNVMTTEQSANAKRASSGNASSGSGNTNTR